MNVDGDGDDTTLYWLIQRSKDKLVLWYHWEHQIIGGCATNVTSK